MPHHPTHQARLRFESRKGHCVAGRTASCIPSPPMPALVLCSRRERGRPAGWDSRAHLRPCNNDSRQPRVRNCNPLALVGGINHSVGFWPRCPRSHSSPVQLVDTKPGRMNARSDGRYASNWCFSSCSQLLEDAQGAPPAWIGACATGLSYVCHRREPSKKMGTATRTHPCR